EATGWNDRFPEHLAIGPQVRSWPTVTFPASAATISAIGREAAHSGFLQPQTTASHRSADLAPAHRYRTTFRQADPLRPDPSLQTEHRFPRERTESTRGAFTRQRPVAPIRPAKMRDSRRRQWTAIEGSCTEY